MKALVILARYRILAGILAGILSGILSACYNQPQPDLPKSAGTIALSSPELVRGRALYVENCVPCHGAEGHGDGWRVKELEGPKPRDFHNDRTMARMSPTSAFTAISKGVPRSAMSAFDLLSEGDRWSLAFFVLSLAHTDEAATRGEKLAAELRMERPSPRTLSTLGNQGILADMVKRGQDAGGARDVLAYFRRTAPYELHVFGVDTFRNDVGRAVATYRKGEHESAKRILGNSYLDNLDSHLQLILSRQSGVVLTIELQVRSLRKAFSQGLPMAEVGAQAQGLSQSLDLAAPILSQIESNPSLALGAATALSYALDGALFLFLLITLVTRRGADKRERKVLAVGIVTGVAASIAIAMMWSEATFPGGIRIKISLAVSALVAGLALLLLAGLVRHFRWPPQTRTIAAPSWLGVIFLLSAGVLVRDSMEFLPVILLLPSSSLWIGAVVAVVALALLIGLLVTLERRLAISARTGLLAICTATLAIISAGTCARAAQMARYLPTEQAGTMQSPWLSLWPTSQGVLIQLVVAAACTVILVIFTLLPSKAASLN
ncbi:MAG: cytochrome c [Kofleriaceae bacterium]|nr:cytochrome c [Kofleriaceae bacterium]